FEQRSARRVYLAIVYGQPADSGVWRDLLAWNQAGVKQERVTKRHERAKEAVSHYRVLTRFQESALIEVRLETGKRHQIRIQAALRGYPLIGEKIYVYDPPPPRSIRFNRQALHAHQLGFRHPIDDRPLSFESPPPEDFQTLLKSLEKSREV
ncbi:MAG TPA: pseudouridine synthase, partial [Blastocatellia bacterium]|nr:pseudouridine synthase [Blastocatellia bacterium]